MSAPDLSTPEGRAAYRAELRRVARPWRLAGLGFVVVGALLALGAYPDWVITLGWICLGAGWVAIAVALVQRNRYHRRRISGG